MTRAAIYTRISDARDGDTAGIDRQREDCLRLAERSGYEVVGVFEDNNVSATKKTLSRRKQGAMMLAAIAEGQVDVVLAYSAQRLYRQVAEVDSLIDQLRDLPVETVVSGPINLKTADGRFLARVMASVAQHESEKRGELVSRAAVQRAQQGGFNGGRRRFGYSPDAKSLVPEEADAIRWGYAHVQAGGTIAAVTREWRSRGLVGPFGATFTDVTVRDVLLRPLNGGLSYYKGEEVGTTNLPALVSEDTYRIVRAILTDPRRRTGRGKPASTLLAPVLKCGICGARCTGTNKARPETGEKVPSYRCHDGGHVTRTRANLDAGVWALVCEYVERNADSLRRVSPQVPQTNTQMDAERLRERLDELALVFASGDLAAADYAAATREVRGRLEAAERQIAASAGIPSVAAVVSSDDVRASMEALPLETRREIVKELIDRVEIGRAKPGRRFSMDGISVHWRSLAA